MRLDMHPYQGVGPIQFGMTREQVRKAASEPAHPFRKNMFSLCDTDEFTKARVHVFYEAEGDTVEAIEIWQPAKPTLGGATLLDKPIVLLRQQLLETDPEMAEEKVGELQSDKLGLCVWAPTADADPHLPPRSVMMFCRGYWDNFEEKRKNAMLHVMKKLAEGS
ncbi:hypothetical protein [Acanthopleuribacter pedis]|uniref:Uncharacterized protein n=1 Tax=Acanthopleuribacter pedis TaxID=442870 RepID=A0A8J7Q5X7_9BACT|nr:hypothetical protein [Acanthopleuribacter pedis]MBO1317309.1 hypothetical protein [Acanthopleuribacter pedis]MBO1318616.1 hypothetical protein [Acanthopleuribacter pedis]